MALIVCLECKHENVSDVAVVCFYCGFPISERCKKQENEKSIQSEQIVDVSYEETIEYCNIMDFSSTFSIDISVPSGEFTDNHGTHRYEVNDDHIFIHMPVGIVDYKIQGPFLLNMNPACKYNEKVPDEDCFDALLTIQGVLSGVDPIQFRIDGTFTEKSRRTLMNSKYCKI